MQHFLIKVNSTKVPIKVFFIEVIQISVFIYQAASDLWVSNIDSILSDLHDGNMRKDLG